MTASGPATTPDAPPPGASAATGGHRLEAALAWVGWLVAVVSGSVGAWYTAVDQATGHSVIPQSPLSGIAGAAIAAAYGTVGLLLALRRPRLVVAWLFLLIGVVGGLSNYIWGYVGLGLTTGTAPGPVAVVEYAWLNNVLTYPLWVALAILLVVLFPDGRPVDRRWRWVVVAAIVDCIVLGMSLAVEPGEMRLFPLDNPHPAPGAVGPIVDVLVAVALVGVCLLRALALWSLTIRYRLGDPTERRQLKWFAWGSVVTIVGGGVLVVGALAVPEPGSRLTDVSWVIFAAASISLPVAALIAILRERLYDVDRLISRTLVFGFLTAILAGLYSAMIRLFNAVFVGVTGQSSELTLVLTTLVLATTFTPIKKWLEDLAAQRFKALDAAGGTAAATAPAGDMAQPGPEGGSPFTDGDELDRRIEAIARRVSLDVLAGLGQRSSALRLDSAPEAAAQDHQAEQDEDQRPEEVTQTGEAGP